MAGPNEAKFQPITQGKPGQIETAATAWTTAGGQLDDVAAALRKAGNDLAANWQGKDADAATGAFTQMASVVQDNGTKMKDAGVALTAASEAVKTAKTDWGKVQAVDTGAPVGEPTPGLDGKVDPAAQDKYDAYQAAYKKREALAAAGYKSFEASMGDASGALSQVAPEVQKQEFGTQQGPVPTGSNGPSGGLPTGPIGPYSTGENGTIVRHPGKGELIGPVLYNNGGRPVVGPGLVSVETGGLTGTTADGTVDGVVGGTLGGVNGGTGGGLPAGLGGSAGGMAGGVGGIAGVLGGAGGALGALKGGGSLAGRLGGSAAGRLGGSAAGRIGGTAAGALGKGLGGVTGGATGLTGGTPSSALGSAARGTPLGGATAGRGGVLGGTPVGGNGAAGGTGAGGARGGMMGGAGGAGGQSGGQAGGARGATGRYSAPASGEAGAAGRSGTAGGARSSGMQAGGRSGGPQGAVANNGSSGSGRGGGAMGSKEDERAQKRKSMVFEDDDVWLDDDESGPGVMR